MPSETLAVHKLRLPFLSLLFILSYLSLLSPQTYAWEHTYEQISRGIATTVDANGDVITAGKFYGLDVVKMSGATGREMWRYQAWDYPVPASSEDVAVDAAGDVYVVGYDNNTVTKLSGATGAFLWRTEILPGPGLAYLKEVEVDQAGNIVAAGYVSNNFTVGKLTKDGTLLWNFQLRTGFPGVANSVASDGDGNVVAAGTLDNNFFVVKLSSSEGAELWRRRIGYTEPGLANFVAQARSVAVDKAGNVAVAGLVWNRNEVANFISSDFTVAKLNGSTGEPRWTNMVDGSASYMIFCRSREDWVRNANDEANTVGVDASGNVIAAGVIMNKYVDPDDRCEEHPQFVEEFEAIKYSSDGEEEWRGFIDSPQNPLPGVAHKLTIDRAGNTLIVGKSGGRTVLGKFRPDGVLRYRAKEIKMEGQLVWSTLDLGSDTPNWDVATDKFNHVIGAGERLGPDGLPRFTVRKFRGEDGTDYLANPTPNVPETVVKYAPMVYLHPDEKYWPENPVTFIHNSSLNWFHEGGCGYQEVAARGSVQAARLGKESSTPYTASPDFPTINRASCVPIPGIEFQADDYTRPWDEKRKDYNSFWKDSFYEREGFYLDQDDSDSVRQGIKSIPGNLIYPGAQVFYEYVPGQYVTYWFFYAYDDFTFPHPVLGNVSLQHHEGDWERISVQLDSSDLPLNVFYYSHSDGQIAYWQTIDKYEGTHPVVYSAKGSHASYPSEGLQQTQCYRDICAHDSTARGPQWLTWENLQKVEAQPWYNFGGAWGAVGAVDTPVGSFFGGDFTGPLGPSRYKNSESKWNPPAPASLTPVIFIPGIGGSVLSNGNDEIWPGLAENHYQLSLDPYSEYFQTSNSLIPSDVIRPLLYESLISSLKDAGYVEGGVSPTLFIFPYDWRKSNAVNSALLKDKILEIREKHPDSKVNIVAHSMGGVLARRYILDNPDPDSHHVDKLITIGSPWLGAPKAINVLETGDFLEGIMKGLARSSTIKKLVEYFPGTHELLPSEAYFKLGGRPFAEEGWDVNQDGLGEGALPHQEYAYHDLYRLLNGAGEDHARFSVSQPYRANEAFHSTEGQDKWTEGLGVSYYHLYGQKQQADTIERVVAKMRVRCRRGRCWRTPYFDPELGPGDGTVPFLSAVRKGEGGNYNLENAVLIPFTDGDVSHNGLTSNKGVQDKVISILSESSTPATASSTLNTVPAASPSGRTVTGGKEPYAGYSAQSESSAISGATALSDEPQLKQAYYVKALGVSSATVTDAAGATGVLLGNGPLGELSGVTSYLLAPDSVLAVTATGQSHTFNLLTDGSPLTVDLTKGTNAETVQAIRYLDIDLPANTLVSLQITPAGVGALSYDGDGDGVVDTPVTPTVSVVGADAQDSESPTIGMTESVSGGRRLVSLTATDALTGVSSLTFSLDGINFRPYTGVLSLNPAVATVVCAFAQDRVANRSTLYTFSLQPVVADLSVSVAASPLTVLSGRDITYVVKVTNNGPAAADSVVLSNATPSPGMVAYCAATHGGVCAAVASSVQTVNFERLEAGATAVVTLVRTLDCALAQGTLIKSTTSVTSQTLDLNEGNNSAAAVFTVSNPPPVISGVSVDKPELWSPNGKMVDVTVSYQVTDNCGPVTNTLSVTSNEPSTNTGKNADWEIIDAHQLRLRAIRSGAGGGRVYTITVTSTDSGGGKSTKTVTVLVPHDQSQKR